ncbi:type IV pili methyl-accepting chemotaxis transducer N-terminal domain-containing protein [Acidovorax sp. SUPP2825]|uniref:type IV pili methyl-accepting chemotaxis transducer N-terminal domain-containing protein n=1 Tax=Acidovorax sp. SUPP2825 TaxID=2920879 RepID=UPI0023DE62FC|nr:type IV pili methyl-accepting chemotaxis transducer N-terminal domain-containing protein [Acidovorax sp. SUPP2825]GKS97525.1 type IV pili methyl-accepting chemotaxis transducer N-terminal domain-containing protein [Acidovorax sp. SUPP2825]
MRRRRLLLATALGGCAFAARAEVADLNDAINQAGRQRMLSQRMGKAWLALVHGVETANAQQVLDKSLALFERQLAALKAYAPTPAIRATYGELEAAWGLYKATLTGTAPARDAAPAVLQADARVLALAQQGTQQYEATQSKPAGHLVNLAGRQRMLTQRMAKCYLAAALPVDAAAAQAEIAKARSEFATAMAALRTAPQATPRIQQELQLADGQWVFFDAALQRLQGGGTSAKQLGEVFVASENLLVVMDRVTGLYAAA